MERKILKNIKLLIAGSRSIKSFDLEPYINDDVELIISGGACGIDRIAEEYADKHKISKLILRPQYELYGKAAPLKRNEKMVDIADRILIIWDGISKGSRYTENYARNIGKSVTVVLCENNISSI